MITIITIAGLTIFALLLFIIVRSLLRRSNSEIRFGDNFIATPDKKIVYEDFDVFEEEDDVSLRESDPEVIDGLYEDTDPETGEAIFMTVLGEDDPKTEPEPEKDWGGFGGGGDTGGGGAGKTGDGDWDGSPLLVNDNQEDSEVQTEEFTESADAGLSFEPAQAEQAEAGLSNSYEVEKSTPYESPSESYESNDSNNSGSSGLE